jgi:hypothetical protein
MTSEERQIIRSSIYTLIELTFKLLKDKEGLREQEIELLSSNEERLKELINKLS